MLQSHVQGEEEGEEAEDRYNWYAADAGAAQAEEVSSPPRKKGGRFGGQADWRTMIRDKDRVSMCCVVTRTG